MLFFIALIGLLLGWLITGLSDTLTRYASTDPANPLPDVYWTSALVSRLTGRTSPWPRLHLITELGSMIVLMVLWMQFGNSTEMVVYTGLYGFFALIALIDLKYRLILNIVTYPAILAVVFIHLALAQQSMQAVLLGGGMAFGIFFLTAYLKPGQLGGGDVKLAALLGLAFGFPQMLWALIVGAGVGGAVAVYLMTSGKGRRFTIPYAPFLCLGAVAALLYNPIPLLV